MRLSRQSLSVVLVSVLLAMFVVSCTTLVRDGYRALSVSQQTYDSTLSALGDLYHQGMLTESQRDTAIKYGRLYRAAHNEAVTALLAYETDPVPDNKQRYLNSAAKASQQLAALIEFAKPFLVKGDN